MKIKKKRKVLRASGNSSLNKGIIVIRHAESANSVCALQNISLATIKEYAPNNRAIQSLSREEYNNYVKRLARTNQFLAIVDG